MVSEKKKYLYKCKHCGFTFDYIPLQGKDWQIIFPCEYCGSTLGYKKIPNESLKSR